MKYTKAEVKFEHPGMGRDKCDDCVHFQPKQRSCEIVYGSIDPKDWCNKFKREPYLK